VLKTVIFVLLTSLVFSGCGQPHATSGLADGLAAARAAQIPPELKATKELLDVALLANITRPDPFQSLIVTEKPTTAAAAPAPIENPLSGYSLAGIMYRGKNSLAILGIPGGSNKIVHTDQMLEGTNGLQIAVAQITTRSVTLQVVDPPGDLPANMRTTTLKVESMVGHKAKGSADAKSISTGQTPGGAGDGLSSIVQQLSGKVTASTGAPGGASNQITGAGLPPAIPAGPTH